MDELPELLFFDTFAHESSEQLNLDLVQFPKPVYVTEVRIIPLGARVQADFPGGVRLGATNPSQFQIEFFVNDLGKPGASTFETLGGFEYNQNGCINLNCIAIENARKIPTDGLVLRGWYTTITLAVYGMLTANIAEQIIPAVVTPSIPNQTTTVTEVQQIMTQNSLETDWQEPIPTVNMEYTQQPATQYPQQYISQEPFQQEYPEYYNEVPKDPRSYHHTPETDWDTKPRVRQAESDRPREYQKGDVDHEHDRRDRENRRYSRSHSRDRATRDSQDSSRDKDWEHDYREHDSKDWDREHDRDSRYKHSDSYRRYSDRDREERKRPRTPPIVSPKRPYTPHSDHKDSSPPPKETEASEPIKTIKQELEPDKVTPVVEDSNPMDVEEFEPILSDEDIVDDPDNFNDVDYDYSVYTNNDDLIKLFVPNTTILKKYEKKPIYNFEDNGIKIKNSFINVIAIIDDFFKSSLTKYNLDSFKSLNTDLKEDFVHLCEKVSTVFIDDNNFCVLTEIYMKSNDTQNETVKQVKFIIETLVNWIIIALNYEMANAQEQPPYKLRHIKCGVKLAEFCCRSTDFVALLRKRNFFTHSVLVNLYEKEHMALSIKLMILKALDTYLLKKSSVEMFLLGNSDNEMNGFHSLTPINEKSGYKVIADLIKRNPLVRLKFALNSILKKLNLFEALDKMRIIIAKLAHNEDYKFTDEEIDLITNTLKYILSLLQSGSFALSQPRRFLPVTAQFEINRSNCENILIEFFKMQNLLDVLLVLLAGSDTIVNPNIKMPVYEILAHLAETYEGLSYMADNAEIVNTLIKILLVNEEEGGSLEFSDIKSQNLGVNISYKLQCLYHLEFLADLGNQHNFDCDHPDIIDQLHALFCLTFSNPGKFSCSEVIGMSDNNMETLLNLLDFTNFKPDTNKFRKSPGASYIIDLIYVTITYTDNIQVLEKYSKQLLEISSQYDLFEEAMSGKLNEISSLLKPYENFSGSYDIATLMDVINKNMTGVTSLTGSLITSLRILQHIGISKHVLDSQIALDNPLSNFIELKYKHVILQLYPLDGVVVFSKILQELCDYFEQPNLHTTTFVSHQGILIINMIIPCVKLIRQMLTYVIQCRNTKFKDLTAINSLLQTYNLCQSFPVSSLGFFKGRKICREIVDILLVYTQPVSEEIHEKDSLNKTLWTLMCGEVIKYTISAPYTFIAGLSVFSEILPLPLPIQTHQKLDEEESSWAVNLRKLWSAHLHPCSFNIQELISKLCTTSYQPLLNLLRKVCAQISDLAANSAIMIARGMLDNVHSAIVIGEDVKKLVCNGHIARLMNFMACLVTHASLKCAFLNLLRNASGGKGDEKYPAIIQAFAQILRSTSNVTSHVQTQECILSILQTFCDTEITLYQNSPILPEVYLANALPTKENLNMFLITMFDHITGDNSLITFLSAIRTLLLLTEHDYGFFHLREGLLRKTAPFNNILVKLENNLNKDNGDCLATFNTLIEFLRACLEPEEVLGEIAFKPREMKMSIGEVQGLIGWKGKEGTGSPLLRLEEKLKEIVQEDESLTSLLEGLEAMLRTLKVDTSEETKETYVDPVLPQPETLLVQFSGRPLFTSTNTDDERLTSVFWPTGICDENDADVENVTCDLLDICRQDLSPDINLIKQVEKLCRICSSDNGEQEEKEKRMSIQKDKMRRPFITPIRGRGFARSIQVRSDLFRSRPPNTSRPPSLHVDDFVALETCGAQPTGPTGYNKISREMLSTTRISRGPRGRAFVASERAVQYRQMSWWGPGPGRAPY